MASREAAKSFFFFPVYRNGRENAGGKKLGNVKKMSLPGTYKSHPAGGLETNLFLRVASVYKTPLCTLRSGGNHRKSTLARGSRWDYTPLPF